MSNGNATNWRKASKIGKAPNDLECTRQRQRVKSKERNEAIKKISLCVLHNRENIIERETERGFFYAYKILYVKKAWHV